MDAEQVRVLLIEDDPGDARLIKEMLADSDVASFTVECVERLADGLDFLDRVDEDVLLLDLNLPDSEGYETFTRACARAPQVPIISLTGLGDGAMGLRALREGAQDYLVKGEIDGNLLGRAIRYAIERKRTQEALREKDEQLRHAQKMEAVGRLAGGIAHDFNNQLTVVTGYSDLLLSTLAPDDPMYERIVEIHRAAMRAASLTNQLLAFSRKQLLNPHVINLNMIVAEMASPVARMIGEDVRLSVVPGSDLGNVFADAHQVEQAIMNLIVNARDAMPHGGGLTIETANVELDVSQVEGELEAPPGPYVMLAVSDTGTGMSARMVREIFEPFFTTKPDGEGTGLGLSMVYGFMKQSGGHIQVESQEGTGTTFRLYLPRVQADVDLPVFGSETRLPQRGTGTILVVEDEEAVRQILVRVLRESGYTVLETANAREALPIGEHYDGAIDLLISDVVMPETSGPEVAKRLTAVRPEMRVLYITGYAESALVHDRIEGGRSALLVKPFAPSALAEAVHSLLQADNHAPA